jgi:hypothetical protein
MASTVLAWGANDSSNSRALAMNRRIGVACFAICAALHVVVTHAAVTPADKPPSLNCDRGGDIERYGGSEWIVYGCSDGRTLIFATTKENPGSPFVFILTPKDGDYQLYGEGTGDKRATDATYAELKALTTTQITALLTTHAASAEP